MSKSAKGRIPVCQQCGQRLTAENAGHLPGYWDAHENRNPEPCSYCGEKTTGRLKRKNAGAQHESP